MAVRSDTVLASLNWILQEIFDNAQQTGSGEFEVGTFFQYTGFAEVPVDSSGNTEIREYGFNVYEPFIYDGQKILIVDTPVDDATLICHYSSKPELSYDVSTNNFYMLIKNNSSTDGFFWTNSNGDLLRVSGSITSGDSANSRIRFGYSQSIPVYSRQSGLSDALTTGLYVLGHDATHQSYAFQNVWSDKIPGYQPQFTKSVYLPINPTETYTPQTIYEPVMQLVSDWNNNNPSDTINPEDVLTWEELGETDATEEPTENGCCCNCTINVSADGDIYVSADNAETVIYDVDAGATLENNISAAAGAFGAGAIVIDAGAEVSLQALAGAFGAGAISVGADGSIIVNVAAGGFAAGAFGAGAIVNPEINISGEVSGSVSIGATDVNVTISGGDVSFQQSGTVNNYYYYDATEGIQEPFTVDYNEIMSPSEYLDIMDYTNDWSAPYLETIPSDTVSALPAETLPFEIVGVAAPALDAVTQVISSSGLLPLLAPVSAISFYLHFLQR